MWLVGLDDPSPNVFPYSAAEFLKQFKEIPDPHEAGSPQEDLTGDPFVNWTGTGTTTCGSAPGIHWRKRARSQIVPKINVNIDVQ